MLTLHPYRQAKQVGIIYNISSSMSSLHNNKNPELGISMPSLHNKKNPELGIFMSSLLNNKNDSKQMSKSVVV